MQMADIARMAGVSTSTVSRALSGSALIPEATRERIAQLAQSMNYRINSGAANLRRKAVQAVGVAMLGDSMQAISDPFLLSLLGHVADALDERGMGVMLTRLTEGRQHVLTDLVESRQVAGIIVIGQLTWHEHLNALAQRGIPIVVWGAPLDDALYPVVGGDNAMGGYLATQHLLQQGCRNIAFFGDISNPEAGLRHSGHLRALHEGGLARNPALEQSFLFGDKRIRDTINQWITQSLQFDAIFATSDVTAITLMGALSERGMAVPRQVKVVGYDDIALSAHLHPSLTTVRQPTDLAAQALVDLLFECLQGQPRRSVVLPAQLIVRESSTRG
jgi:DNA-binding LacI/PurR family transcriptional regulator